MPEPPHEGLTDEESAIVRLLLHMTGREERLSRDPPLDREQRNGLQAIWPQLKSASARGVDVDGRCDLLNRLLLTLGISPASQIWFQTVFDDVDMSDLSEVHRRVNMFRVLCMLEYGNFRYGYKQLRKESADPGRQHSLSEVWAHHFPTTPEVTRRAVAFRNRPEPVGLIPISASQLFSLGYLAGQHAPQINEARRKLLDLIIRCEKEGVGEFAQLRRVAKEAKIDNVTDLFARAGIPGTEELIYADLPVFAAGKRAYPEILRELREGCITVDEDAIRQAQLDGVQNARTYMAMHDLDVYVATSMREPLHFTTNWAFIQRLFHRGELAEWHIHYFDPTQAFLEDRVQKGLLECLMIKRARLSVYNAQETDTFGKDAEAGVTLAQGKPVVVYVARFGEYMEELKPLYEAVDSAARMERDDFVDHLVSLNLLEGKDKPALLAPQKTKMDAVSAAINANADSALRKVGEDRVALELIRQGYDPTLGSQDLVPFAVERISRLERRALTFRDVHPLSLQTSPVDGVARGIMVTRTVEDTARVVKGVLLGNLKYEIVETLSNWLLLEDITRSPVRVVTKDPILTTAFWSETWGTPPSAF